MAREDDTLNGLIRMTELSGSYQATAFMAVDSWVPAVQVDDGTVWLGPTYKNRRTALDHALTEAARRNRGEWIKRVLEKKEEVI